MKKKSIKVGGGRKKGRTGVRTQKWKNVGPKFNKRHERTVIRYDNIKRRQMEHDIFLFNKYVGTYEKEIMIVNGIIQKIPKHMKDKLKKAKIVYKISYKNVCIRFNNIRKKTFQKDFYKKNPRKFVKNIFLLYLILVFLKEEFKKKSRTLGIPQHMNNTNSLNNISPFILPRNEALEEYMDEAIHSLE